MARYLTDEQLEEIVNNLVGTCFNDLEKQCAYLGLDYELITLGDLEALDELVFECESCGWWCSTDEENTVREERICDDCVEVDEIDDDED